MRLDGAESCVSGPELARRVEARLGRPVFGAPGEAALLVEGRAERTAEGWRATVGLTGPDATAAGERVLVSRAETCDALGDAVVVAVALMIDPVGGLGGAPPEASVAAAPATRVHLDGALAAGLGGVPGVGVGVWGALAVDPVGFVPVLGTAEGVPYARGAATGAVGRVALGAGLCPLAWTRGPLDVRGCLGVQAGALLPYDAAPVGLVDGWGLLDLRGRVLGPLSMRVGLHPTVPLRRAELAGGAWRAAPVGGVVDLGFGVEG